MQKPKECRIRRPNRIKSLVGMRFARLAVVSEADRNSFGHVMWNCICDCSEEAVVSGCNLKRGITRSCGCLLGEMLATRNYRHGMAETPEYHSYLSAKSRCQNPKNHAYANYGGRGIEFKFSSFDKFLLAVGRKPSPSHTLDRINNDGNYELGNVRWSLPQEQIGNRRIKRIENFTDMEFAAEAKRRGYIKGADNE